MDISILIEKWNCQSLSHVQLFVTPWTVALQIHGIMQARMLEWVAIPFSRGSSQPRGWIQVSCTASRFFTIWTTKKAQHINYLFLNPGIKISKPFPFLSLVLMLTLSLKTVFLCLNFHCNFCWKLNVVYWIEGTEVNRPLEGDFRFIWVALSYVYCLM